MTHRALLLALLVAALPGCAEGPSGARLLGSRRTPLGRIDAYRLASGEVRRLWTPDDRAHDWRGVRWLEPWEMPP